MCIIMDMIKRQNIESNKVVSENRKWENQRRGCVPAAESKIFKAKRPVNDTVRQAGAVTPPVIYNDKNGRINVAINT
jgi:hypothetical protein